MHSALTCIHDLRYRILVMVNDDTKVIPLWTARNLPRTAPTNDDLWESALEKAIFPAFLLSQERLNASQRHSSISRPVSSRGQFVVLFWNGQRGLETMRVGLQFTYGGVGKFAFDVSAVRLDGSFRHQTSFYQEYFTGADPHFGSRVMMMCSFGMGMLNSMEASPLAGAQWRSTKVQRPGRLI